MQIDKLHTKLTPIAQAALAFEALARNDDGLIGFVLPHGTLENPRLDVRTQRNPTIDMPNNVGFHFIQPATLLARTESSRINMAATTAIGLGKSVFH